MNKSSTIMVDGECNFEIKNGVLKVKDLGDLQYHVACPHCGRIHEIDETHEDLLDRVVINKSVERFSTDILCENCEEAFTAIIGQNESIIGEYNPEKEKKEEPNTEEC